MYEHIACHWNIHVIEFQANALRQSVRRAGGVNWALLKAGRTPAKLPHLQLTHTILFLQCCCLFHRTMHIRLATTRDLHRLTQITVTSLVDDPAFDYMWPKRHEFPEDNFFFWQLQLKKWLYDPKQTFLVMVLGAQDPPPSEETPVIPDTIISYVIWERLGHSEIARRRWAEKDTWQNLLDSASALFPLAVLGDTNLLSSREYRQSRSLVNITQIRTTRCRYAAARSPRQGF